MASSGRRARRIPSSARTPKAKKATQASAPQPAKGSSCAWTIAATRAQTIQREAAQTLQKDQRRHHLQREAAHEGETAPLPKCEPDQGRALEGEDAGRELRAQRERDRQRGSGDREDRERIPERPGLLPAAEERGEGDVGRGHPECHEGEDEGRVVEHPRLHAEVEDRIAEDEQAAHRRLDARPPGLEQGEADEEGVEERREGLDAPEVLGLVARGRPGSHEGGRQGEGERAEEAPPLPPGDGDDEEVEDRVPGEEHHVAPPAAGDQDRREKAGERGQHGERRGVLHDREDARSGDEADQEREGQLLRHEIVEAEGDEDREVEDADGAALERQRKSPPPLPLPLPESENQRAQRREGHGPEAHLDRCVEPPFVGRVLEEGADPGEEDHHPHLRGEIALQEPPLRHLQPTHPGSAGGVGGGAAGVGSSSEA